VRAGELARESESERERERDTETETETETEKESMRGGREEERGLGSEIDR
jgi:hypothetical protein